LTFGARSTLTPAEIPVTERAREDSTLVRSIFRKLDVSSRIEVAELVEREERCMTAAQAPRASPDS
jgi:hypothetical protein